jgi:isocitrate dehydrogenase
MDIVTPPPGQKIVVSDDFSLSVSNHPIIPFIEGDGVGVDITPVMRAAGDLFCVWRRGD